MTPRPGDEEMRLQKYLSRAGVASRRDSEELMVQGRVRVNGIVTTTLGAKVDPARDRVEVDGRVVTPERARWLLLHKPPGYLTTARDPRGRKTVYELLPDDADSLSYVGRLDLPTEGLLLMSNDGEAVHRLLHPSTEVEREYRAWVKGVPDRRSLERLEQGVRLEDGMARAKRVRSHGQYDGGTRLTLVLTEGRKREVRRMLSAIGHPVRRLKRMRFGPQRLGELPRGEWRELSDDEVRALRRAAGLETDDIG